MKKILKLYMSWLIIWLGILTMLWWGYLLIRARNSSSSWLTVDGTSPVALYVGAGETLTAAKRNRLVQWNERKEVSTSDTALFDSGCERKWQISNSPYNSMFWASNMRAQDGSRIKYSDYLNDYYIDNTLKWTTKLSSWWTSTTLHVRKKCR